SRASHAVGMPERNRAAVDVESIVLDTEFVATVQDLDRERLVELPQVDVGNLLAGALEQFGNREHRADAHLVRLATGHRKPPERAQRLESELRRTGGAHNHTG